jgi:hypothetical protein
MVLIFLITGYSCIDEYDLKQKYNGPRLVVEGTITNQKGPYVISLTKSRLQLSYDPYANHTDNMNYSRWSDGVEPIYDAKVYITDKNTLITDTLAALWTSFRGKPYASDSIGYLGQYQTKNIIGIPGHTYTLNISWQNQEYHAESYMPPITPLDSTQFNFTKGAIGKEDYNIPLLFFKEPQNERNYYLFITPGNSRVWPYSILSDEFLDEYVYADKLGS